jgi:DNA-binding GntR family transcriptional regulator
MNAANSPRSPFDASPERLEGQALVDNLAQRIQTRIMTGEFPIGTRLRQEALAAEFGVSRTPIREALRQLQASGILVLEPRRGATVHGPSQRDVLEAYAVRAELEGFAAELCTDLIPDDDLRKLREAAEMFGAAVEEFATADRSKPISADDARWPTANDLFHEVILRAAGNARLHEAVRHLHLSFPRNLTWSVLSSNTRFLKANVKQHHDVLEAIEQRQPRAARRHMRDHIRRSGELVAESYGRALERGA